MPRKTPQSNSAWFRIDRGIAVKIAIDIIYIVLTVIITAIVTMAVAHVTAALRDEENSWRAALTNEWRSTIPCDGGLAGDPCKYEWGQEWLSLSPTDSSIIVSGLPEGKTLLRNFRMNGSASTIHGDVVCGVHGGLTGQFELSRKVGGFLELQVIDSNYERRSLWFRPAGLDSNGPIQVNPSDRHFAKHHR